MASVDLRLGDCLEILPTLADKSVDTIITDLPYGTTACSWDVVIPFEPMWEQVKRILKERGAFVTTAAQPFTSLLVVSNLEWFKYEWVWKKTVAANFMNAKLMPLKRHENVLVFSPGKTSNGHANNMTYNAQGVTKVNKIWRRPQKYESEHRFDRPSHNLERVIEYSNLPETVIEFSNGHNDKVHPTQKPVALYEYLIKTYTNPGDTVLDFCAGSGTTGVAAIRTGRNAILIEREPKYFEVMQRRIAEAQQQMTMELA